MNWRHLQAIVWLRWRLVSNQCRRAGTFNAVLLSIVTFGALATALPLFIASFALGVYLIPRAAPAHLMYAWDGVIIAFLFFWAIGLVTELQRSEPLSLSKFLHLPVSLNGAFVINYLSSLLRLSLILFVPPMLGFALALIVAKGGVLLPVLPLLAAFLLMVTALTYQLQGWLASMMDNPRRRRTVIVTTTGIFVVLCQLPNLLNAYAPWSSPQNPELIAARTRESEQILGDLQAGKIEPHEYTRRQDELRHKYERALQQARRETTERWTRAARLVNLAIPAGWLPLGVMSAAEGQVVPSILGVLGMTLIGSASLWRAYRGMIAQYRGESTNRRGRPAPASAVARPSGVRKPGDLLIEARIPGLSEPVSVIALGGFRSFVRSPEAKMMMLTPLIMIPILGSILMQGTEVFPEWVRPLLATVAMGFLLMGTLQMMGNQFGFDRDGFRVFVLCAAPRRDILFGKNLSFVPVALVMAAIVLTIVQIFLPMHLDHLLAMFPLYVTMFLLYCLLANFMSIYAPVRVAAGSMKASNPRLTTILLQMVIFVFLYPLIQAATLLPLGIEFLLKFLGWTSGAPVCLILNLAECAAVVPLYHFLLDWQAGQLQAREGLILETVTGRAA